jgi:hypothetical protein
VRASNSAAGRLGEPFVGELNRPRFPAGNAVGIARR